MSSKRLPGVFQEANMVSTMWQSDLENDRSHCDIVLPKLSRNARRNDGIHMQWEGLECQRMPLMVVCTRITRYCDFVKWNVTCFMRRTRKLNVILWVTRRTTNIINATLHAQSLPRAICSLAGDPRAGRSKLFGSFWIFWGRNMNKRNWNEKGYWCRQKFRK